MLTLKYTQYVVKKKNLFSLLFPKHISVNCFVLLLRVLFLCVEKKGTCIPKKWVVPLGAFINYTDEFGDAIESRDDKQSVKVSIIISPLLDCR